MRHQYINKAIRYVAQQTLRDNHRSASPGGLNLVELRPISAVSGLALVEVAQIRVRIGRLRANFRRNPGQVWPKRSHVWPNPVNSRPIWAGQSWSNPEIQAKVGRFRAKFARHQAKFARNRAKFGRSLPMLADIGEMSVDSGPSLASDFWPRFRANFGRCRANFGRVGSIVAEIEP